MKVTAGVFLLLAALATTAPVQADVVILQNGVKMEGILTKDDDGNQALEVSESGIVTLDSATVVSIQPQTAKENARLRQKWAGTDQEAIDRERFAASQRAKGLIPLDDEWVTPAEYDRRLASDALDLDRYTAAHPAVRRRIIYASSGGSSDSDTETTIFYTARKRKAHVRTFSADSPLPKISRYSSSGNFIRKSEFVSPTSLFGHGGKYFDPSTGLYK